MSHGKQDVLLTPDKRLRRHKLEANANLSAKVMRHRIEREE